MDNWKIVMTCTYPHEAHVAQGYLDSLGIETLIKDELTVQVHNFYSNAIGGVKLFVRNEDYEQGLQALQEGGYVIANHENEEPINEIDLKAVANKKVCPYCQSDNIGEINQPSLFSVILYFIIGAIFPFYRYAYMCFECDKRWRYVKKAN